MACRWLCTPCVHHLHTIRTRSVHDQHAIRTRSVRHPYTILIPNAVACTWLQPRMRGDHRASFGRLQEHGGWREVAAGYKRLSCNDLLHGLARRNPKDKTRDPKTGRIPKSEHYLICQVAVPLDRQWFRPSAFGFLSAFGIWNLDLNQARSASNQPSAPCDLLSHRSTTRDCHSSA